MRFTPVLLTVLIGFASLANSAAIERELNFGFKDGLRWTCHKHKGPRPGKVPGTVTIRNARKQQQDPDKWFDQQGFKCQVLENDPVVKEAMRLLMLYQAFDSRFPFDSPTLVKRWSIAPRKNQRIANTQLFARVYERPEAMTVISYALGLKGRALDMLSANFRTSKYSRAAEKEAVQARNIPIPTVHEDFWVLDYITTATVPRCPKEYQQRFAKFRQNKDKVFNVWIPFGHVDWWNLAVTSKGSCRGPNWNEEQDDLKDKVKSGRGPGKWWYYPNMTGIFNDKSEAIVFKSSNFHSGVKPPQDGKTFRDRQSIECRFIDDVSLPPVSLKEARKAALKISSILGHSQDLLSKKVWELLNSNGRTGTEVFQSLKKNGELPILGQIYQRLDKFSKETSPLKPYQMLKFDPVSDLLWLWILLAVAIIGLVLCVWKKHKPEVPQDQAPEDKPMV